MGTAHAAYDADRRLVRYDLWSDFNDPGTRRGDRGRCSSRPLARRAGVWSAAAITTPLRDARHSVFSRSVLCAAIILLFERTRRRQTSLDELLALIRIR